MSRRIVLLAAASPGCGRNRSSPLPRPISAAALHGASMDRCSASAETCSEVAGPLAERLKEMDANKDGVVTLEEFLAPPRRRLRAPRQERRRRRSMRSDFAALRQGKHRLPRQALPEDVRHQPRRQGHQGGVRAARQGALRHARPQFRRRDRPRRHGPRHARARPRGRGGPGSARKARRQPGYGREAGKADEPDKGERRSFDLDRLLGRTDRRFARLDKNGDGFVDAKDLEPAAAERVDFATKRFFRQFDANGDGKVSRDEFERFAKERFAMLDLDDDGRITDADLPPRMRGRGILK